MWIRTAFDGVSCQRSATHGVGRPSGASLTRFSNAMLLTTVGMPTSPVFADNWPTPILKVTRLEGEPAGPGEPPHPAEQTNAIAARFSTNRSRAVAHPAIRHPPGLLLVERRIVDDERAARHRLRRRVSLFDNLDLHSTLLRSIGRVV